MAVHTLLFSLNAIPKRPKPIENANHDTTTTGYQEVRRKIALKKIHICRYWPYHHNSDSEEISMRSFEPRPTIQHHTERNLATSPGPTKKPANK
eukprot:80268-Amphidinium_carterae.1